MRSMTRRSIYELATGAAAGSLAFFAVLLPLTAWAGDHERAREARERGDIKPLEEILPSVEQRFPGEIVKVELEREDGRWIYEIKLIDNDGRLLQLEIDARNAEIIEVGGR